MLCDSSSTKSEAYTVGEVLVRSQQPGINGNTTQNFLKLILWGLEKWNIELGFWIKSDNVNVEEDVKFMQLVDDIHLEGTVLLLQERSDFSGIYNSETYNYQILPSSPRNQ